MRSRSGICLAFTLLLSPSLAEGAQSADDHRKAAGTVFQDCARCPSMIVIPPDASPWDRPWMRWPR